jgi:hypothetical protein
MSQGTKGFGAGVRKAAKAAPRSAGGSAGGGGISVEEAAAPVADHQAPPTVSKLSSAAPPPAAPAEAPPKLAAGGGAAKKGGAVGAGGAAAATAVAKKPQPEAPPAANAPCVPVPADQLWTHEYHQHHGEEIQLKDGSSFVVGEKYKGENQKVTLGKQLPFSTGGYYFGGGLAKLKSVHVDPQDKNVVYAVMNDGYVASYDNDNWIVGGKPSENGEVMTQAQAAAVIAGDYQKARDDDSPLAKQFASAYTAWAESRDKDSLLKCADAHYAYKKAAGNPTAFNSPLMVKKAKAFSKQHGTKAQAEAPAGQAALVPEAATPKGQKEQPSPVATLPKTKKAYDPDKVGGHFDTLQQANDWARKAYGPWSESLTHAERGSLSSYKGSGYGALNKAMRKAKNDPEKMTGHAKAMAKDLNGAFAKAPALEAPMVVYRGRLPNSVCEAFKKGDEAALVGQAVRDDAFMSTSFDRGVAEMFSHSSKYSCNTVARITVPKGQKAVYMENFNKMGESEMLLPPGCNLRITNAYHKGGRYWVDAVVEV